MKIISKYKDFYDYIVQDNDADLNFVRNLELIYEYYDDLFDSDNIHLPYFNSRYGYIDKYYYKIRSAGDVVLDNYIFGIYPFVYSQPYIRVHYLNICGHDETLIIILSKHIVDLLLNKSTETEGMNELKNIIYNELNNIKYKSEKPIKLNFSKDFTKSLQKYVWKINCNEIFYKINAPVFTKYYYELYADSAYWLNWPNTSSPAQNQKIHYVANISFQKLNYNILKYWYDEIFDINTYINIENFLWSVKQEPVANPDNKTKIIAHGFDLKTSFRKM